MSGRRLNFLLLLLLIVIGSASASSPFDGYTKDVAKGELLLKLGKYDEAKETAEAYLSSLDNDTIKDVGVAMAWAVKGDAEWLLGQREAGFNNLEKAIYLLAGIDSEAYKEMSQFTDIFLETAACAYELGLYEKCINYNNAYIFLTNDNRNYDEKSQNSFLQSVYISMKAARELNQYEKIIERVPLVRDVTPKTPYGDKMLLQILMIGGESLVNIGAFDEAVKVYNMCLAGAKHKFADDQHLNFEINRQLALALEKAGKLPEAKEVYESILPTLDSSFVTFDTKAGIIVYYVNILSILGDNKKALDIYSSYIPQLVSLATNQEEINTIYSVLYSLQKQNHLDKEAKETFDKYLANNAQNNGQELDITSLYFKTLQQLESGDMSGAKDNLDIMKNYFELINDSLSINYGNYLNCELVYCIATRKQFDPSLEESFLRHLNKNYSPGHEYYQNGISNLMNVSFFNLDKQKTKNYMDLYMKGVSKMISERFLVMDREDREKYWTNMKSTLSSLIPFYCMASGDESINEKGYQAALLSKGLLLRSELLINEFFKDNGKHENYNKDLEEKITSVLSIASQENIDEKALNNAIEGLITESPLYSMFAKRLEVKTEDVKTALKPDEAAIEFVWVQTEDNKNSALIAYLLRHDFKYPKLFVIMMQSHWDEMQQYNLYHTPVLSKILWRDMKEHLSDVKKVYFAPDGPLHAVSIESMPDYEIDNAIMSDRWDMIRLSSTREIAVKDASKNNQSGVLFGGAVYDASQESIKDKEMAGQTRGALHVTFGEDDIEGTGLRAGVDYLPETLIEVNNINSLFSNAKVACKEMTGASASEKNFKTITEKDHSVIHLATHGFYWSKKDASKLNSLSFLSGENGNKKLSEEELALRRSGLLFSGANRVLTGGNIPEGNEDGVLTAYEIAGLDLSSVDLLVLSACETGLGDIEADGVFGLQRGFKKAGTKTILMSLWKVDDKATQMLMTEFYRGYLSGMDKVKALTAAQQFVRNYEEEIDETESDETEMTASQRRKAAREGEDGEESQVNSRKVKVHPYKDPKYWAAFILLDAVN